ncbi:hypothetical protein F5Y16DRAFT_403647 [Xylariaceae sp. FL0255]|nr:hypothetical protein F5Y16DRAFT_403647 [Xylariaceae sp. FL0255]
MMETTTNVVPAITGGSSYDDDDDDDDDEKKNLVPLLKLPVELVKDIGEFLGVANGMSLALTCKALFNILGHDLAVKLPNDRCGFSRLDLLHRLERDGPCLAICSLGLKLVSYRPDWPKIPAMSSAVFYRRSYPKGCHMPGIRWFYTRLIRNEKVFGEGRPLSWLSLDREHILNEMDENRQDRTIITQSTRRAIWFHEDLLVCYTSKIHVDDVEQGQAGEIPMLYAFLGDAMKNGLCHQGPLRGYFQNFKAMCVLKGLPRAQIITSIADSCRECDTDWQVSIDWDHNMKAMVVTYCSYHNLGDCELPVDKKWESQCRKEGYLGGGRVEKLGDIRKKWKWWTNHFPV